MLNQNYNAEETKLSYWGRASLVPLELVLFYNSANRTAWNRFFFNEENYATFE